MRFTVDLVNATASGTLTVKVWTKNSEDPGDGDQALSSPTITVDDGKIGRSSDECSDNLKELVRYKFEVTGGAGEYCLFRMLSPVWFNDVKA